MNFHFAVVRHPTIWVANLVFVWQKGGIEIKTDHLLSMQNNYTVDDTADIDAIDAIDDGDDIDSIDNNNDDVYDIDDINNIDDIDNNNDDVDGINNNDSPPLSTRLSRHGVKTVFLIDAGLRRKKRGKNLLQQLEAETDQWNLKQKRDLFETKT